MPLRTNTSRRLRAAAVSATTTSPAPATGSGALHHAEDLGASGLTQNDGVHVRPFVGIGGPQTTSPRAPPVVRRAGASPASRGNGLMRAPPRSQAIRTQPAEVPSGCPAVTAAPSPMPAAYAASGP